MFGGNNNQMFSSNPTTEDQEKGQGPKEDSGLGQMREQLAVSIRKNDRDQEIMKRRKMNSTAVVTQELPLETDPFQAKIREFTKRQYTISQINQLNQCMQSGDIEKSHYGIIGVRKILSADKEPPIQIVIDANLVPQIIAFARQDQYPILRAEATWALTNIASGTGLQTQSVIDKGGIQLFVELLKSSDELVLQQAVWAVANIAADRPSYRDSFIKQGVINVLCEIIEKCNNLKVVTHSCWALTNIIRTKPAPKFEYVKRALPTLAHAVMNKRITNEKTLTCVLNVFAMLIDNHSSRISAFMQTGIATSLFEMLRSENKHIPLAALKVLGTISYSNELQLESILSLGLLQHLEVLIDYPKDLVKKEVCWMLSNVSASVEKHVSLLLAHQNLIVKTYNMLLEATPASIKKQISHMFINIAETYSTPQMIAYFHEKNFMQIFLGFVKDKTEALTEIGLKGVEVLLRIGQENKKQFNGKSVMMGDFLQNQGIDILEDAQMHPNMAVYDLTASILKTYFEIDDPLK